MAEPVTIKDVAGAAGVSVATVSRVMNGVSSVDPALASKVLQAVERLGYRPNMTARGLVSGRTSLVGVIVPDLSNPYFHGILKALTAAAADDDFSAVIVDANESAEREVTLARRLLSQTDGVVLCSPRADAAQLRLLGALGQPIVCVNRVLVGISIPSVVVAEHEAALSLAAHLFSQGHRRIVYLEGPAASWSNTERRRALADAGSFGLEVVNVACGADAAAGFAVVDEVVSLDVTAIVAFNDYVALGVLAGLREKDLDVPSDFSLAAFDDIPLASYVTPGITSVRRPVADLAQQAWKALCALLAGGEAPEAVPLAGELVVRASVAPPRDGSRPSRLASPR